MLSGGTQRRALSGYQSEEMSTLNISSSRVGIKLTTCRAYSRIHESLRHDWPRIRYFIDNCENWETLFVPAIII